MEITYTLYGGNYYPNICLSEPPPNLAKPLGRYGMLRKNFLKEHRIITYNTMLLKETLYPHLRYADKIARNLHRRGIPPEIILDVIVYE